MNKTQYMESLIELCTEKQKDFFLRIYPDGPNPSQVKRATQQIEATLKQDNLKIEQLKGELKAHQTSAEEAHLKLKSVSKELVDCKSDKEDLQLVIDRISNPIDIENSEVQSRLSLLNALEAGGVDNWEWYDHAIKTAKQTAERNK